MNKGRGAVILLWVLTLVSSQTYASDLANARMENAQKGKQLTEEFLKNSWVDKCVFLFMSDEAALYIAYDIRPEVKVATCVTILGKTEFGRETLNYVEITIDVKNDTYEINHIPALNMIMAVPTQDSNGVKNLFEQVRKEYREVSKITKIKVLVDDFGISGSSPINLKEAISVGADTGFLLGKTFED